jgi:putative RecB family exonuclease
LMRIANEQRPHFSISQLTCYLQCPLQYYFQYEKGLRWKATPSAIAFGSSVHNAVEKLNRSLMAGNPINEAMTSMEFVNAWNESRQEKITWKEDPEELLVKGQELVALYHQEVKDQKPTEVELQFRLPIVDPSTGVFVESRDLVGKIDAIFGEDTVVEIKTAYRSPVQQEIDGNLQLTLYSWAYRMLFGASERTLKVINLVKTKDPKLVSVETEKDHSWLIATISQVIRAIDLKLFYPNPIGGFGCFNCQYQEQCREPIKE